MCMAWNFGPVIFDLVNLVDAAVPKVLMPVGPEGFPRRRGWVRAISPKGWARFWFDNTYIAHAHVQKFSIY